MVHPKVHSKKTKQIVHKLNAPFDDNNDNKNVPRGNLMTADSKMKGAL